MLLNIAFCFDDVNNLLYVSYPGFVRLCYITAMDTFGTFAGLIVECRDEFEILSRYCCLRPFFPAVIGTVKMGSKEQGDAKDSEARG